MCGEPPELLVESLTNIRLSEREFADLLLSRFHDYFSCAIAQYHTCLSPGELSDIINKEFEFIETIRSDMPILELSTDRSKLVRACYCGIYRKLMRRIETANRTSKL